jgi:hypothetical protein
VSAASGEPEVIADIRWAADADNDKAVMLTPVVVREILAAYDTLAQQRDAAVRERDELANWKRETESFSRTFLGFGMTHDNESVWCAMGGANQNYSYYVGQCEQLQAENESLRARLAAAEAALATIRNDAQTTLDLYDKNGPQWTSRESGEEYYSASYVLETARTTLATAQKDTTDDFGPNDGHTRTGNRSAWQEGKV